MGRYDLRKYIKTKNFIRKRVEGLREDPERVQSVEKRDGRQRTRKESCVALETGLGGQDATDTDKSRRQDEKPRRWFGREVTANTSRRGPPPVKDTGRPRHETETFLATKSKGDARYPPGPMPQRSCIMDAVSLGSSTGASTSDTDHHDPPEYGRRSRPKRSTRPVPSTLLSGVSTEGRVGSRQRTGP